MKINFFEYFKVLKEHYNDSDTLVYGVDKHEEPPFDDCADSLNEAHVFIYDSNEGYRTKHDRGSEIEAIDLPFKKCLFQIKTGFFFAMDAVWDGFAKKQLGVETFLIEEKSPLNYDIFIFSIDKESRKLGFHRYHYGVLPNKEYLQILSLIQTILNNLRGQSFAREIVNESFKTKVKGKKQQIKISNVTHVYPNKNETPKGLHGRNLEWSHRWEVRGHWRKIIGVGKDRTGAYNQTGFTWVVNHEKGPLEKELVQKITVVH